MEDLEVDWNDRDSEFDDDDSEESSLDLRLNEQQFSDLLVAPADWTIETLYSQIGKQIDLNPEFQRRPNSGAKHVHKAEQGGTARLPNIPITTSRGAHH